jgi:hypothetical protein
MRRYPIRSAALLLVWRVRAQGIGVLELKTLKGNAESMLKTHGESVAAWICHAITVSSIVVRLIMYFKDRSFYIDEAFLAENIVTRDFRSLLSAPLVNEQTAPAFYVYAVKLFGALTGYGEDGLRFFSLLMLAGLLLAEYFLLTRAFRVGRAWTAFAIAATATLDCYMRYSNELKPYMGDCFFVLLVLSLYHLHHTRRVGLVFLTTASCLVLLFSSPSLFFVASVFACEFAFAVVARDRGRSIRVFCAGTFVLAFFLAYYTWWLGPAAESDFMNDFWKDMRFKLWPAELSTLSSNMRLAYSEFGIAWFLHFSFACLGFIALATKKDRLTCVVGLAAVLLLLASSMGKYPFAARLWLFTYALNIIYMTIFFASTRAISHGSRSLALSRLFAFVAVVVVLLNARFINFAGDRLYMARQEANPLISYLQEHVGAGEHVYVYPTARYIVRYKNGYGVNRMGNTGEDNIIWGGGLTQTGKMVFHWDSARAEWGESNHSGARNEIDRIVAAGRAWLLFYDHWESPSAFGIETGLATLKSLGHLHKVGEFHETPLYYFTTDANDPVRSRTHDFAR